jgi:hypothetical protein
MNSRLRLIMLEGTLAVLESEINLLRAQMLSEQRRAVLTERRHELACPFVEIDQETPDG